jgi:predicted regulator of Ras-like GTPase activity (Roadblock/LC7/MglB family)
MPIQKKKPAQIEDEEQVDWAPKIEEQAEIADLRACLEKVKSIDGVIGYIIRGPSSASVDIKNPSKIIDYAALSADAVESSEGLSETFELGRINNIIVEGKNVKILSFKKGEQELSIFMEKNVDHNAIFKELA